MSRFASITADLLVRKGEAKPKQPATILESGGAPAHHATPPPFHDEPVPDDVSWRDEPGARPMRRCTIRLTECEYQRLGIVAVKKDITRQHVLRQAVEDYLASAERTYGRDCGCLGGCGHDQ